MFGDLTRRVAVVAVGRLAVPVAALATNMILARTLSREWFGRIQEVNVLVQIGSVVASAGIQTSLYNFLPRWEGTEPRRFFVTQSSVLLAGMAAVVALGALVGADGVARWYQDPSLAALVRVAAAALWVSVMATMADPLFVVLGRPDLSAAATIATSTLQVALVGLLVRDGQRVSYFFWAMVWAQGARLLWSLTFASRVLGGRPWWGQPPVGWRDQWLFILPVTLTTAVDTASSYLDRLLVGRYFGAETLAVYANGAVEVPLLGVLMSALTPVLLPHLAEQLAAGHYGAALEVWKRAVRKGATILFGVFWLFLWIAPEFVVMLFSERYRESAAFFRVYLLLLPLRAIAFMPVLYALGCGRAVWMGAVGDLVANLAVSWVLMRWTPLGPAGAAWGTVLATMGQALYYMGQLRRAMAVEWRHLLPWKALAGDFGLACVWMLPLAGARVLESPSAAMLATAALLGASYAGYVVLPRLRSPGEAARDGR